jgi:predicted amidohydrolase YtcJ
MDDRVSIREPFVSLGRMITAKRLRGDVARAHARLRREETLRLDTCGSVWIAQSEHRLGSLEPGELADLVVLSDDYVTVPEGRISRIRSPMTIVGGSAVHETSF